MTGFYEINSNPPNNHWEARWAGSERDFIIRRVALSSIVMINLGIVATAIAFTVMYTPFPTTAYLISPFVAGVLAALIYMKYPTGGINAMNYQEYTNPAVLMGKALAYLLFGPLMILRERCDWNAYHDPWVAKEIVDKLKTETFKAFAPKYGRHFKNLVKYGFIPKQYKGALVELNKAYEPVDRGLHFHKNKETSQKATLEERKATIEKQWTALRGQFIRDLPRIKTPDVGFVSLSERAWVEARNVVVGEE